MPELTQADLEDWIANKATGKFHYTRVMDGTVAPQLYPQLRNMMKRAGKKGITCSVDGKDGWWRPVDKSIEEICWWDSEGVIGDNIILPLGINKHCYIPLPSLIIVAAPYNVGKTAFCINLVNDNIELWKDRLDFYVSEGAEMMRGKFDIINEDMPKPPPFKTFRRTENFADIIKPDNLSVIDYLRVNMEKSYAVGDRLFEIFSKLDKGIAVVAMQKPPGSRKLAFGGAATAFEPSLYIWMDKNTLGFEKIKVPKITAIDPYELKIKYSIYKGAKFYNVKEEVDNL
ncbi:hypothetical protein LCGC14_1191750 [marine sediment metagenome]|uniref:Uncharacterized protein n=1 Tax=marine sediment metagenome TaxID=412755 RepID=A0A0F9LJ82_9ZZZZ